MVCNKNHSQTDFIIKDLPISQGGVGRHKCAACAYEKGVENGKNHVLNFDLEMYISSLPESQKDTVAIEVQLKPIHLVSFMA